MKNLIKIIPIITSLFFGCLIINSFSDVGREAFAADLEKRMQTVDPVLEAKFLLMERGKIPIGECVDEAEDLAQRIIDEMDTLNEDIEEEISAGNKLIWLPEECKCGNCSNHCDCEYDEEGKCTSCHCTDCEGNVCPFDEIKKRVDTIQETDNKIIESSQRIENLIEAENLEQYDPDRWEILNKLLNSRYKMEECVQGFESAIKHPRTEINFLSCRTALHEIEKESGGLVLLEYFENHISDYPYCYPYTANSSIRKICKANKDSDDCHIPLKGCMDNYFCAGFVGPTGDLGGNKEGDEPQVEDGEMPHCSFLYVPSDPPAPPAPPAPPNGVPPDNECAKRVLKALADEVDFDIVRGTNRLITTYYEGGHSTKLGFICDEICADRGQDCLGIGLYGVEKTYCKYIWHNLGMDCQLSKNLNWGECDMAFTNGAGFCEENIPPNVYSWGNNDTGCYCVDKGYLPEDEEEEEE